MSIKKRLISIDENIDLKASEMAGYNGHKSINDVYVAAVTEYVGKMSMPAGVQSADFIADSRIQTNWQPDSQRVPFALTRAGCKPFTQEQVQAFISHYRAKPPNRQVDWDEMFINWCIKSKAFNHGQNQRQAKFDPGEYILDGIENDLRQNKSSASVRQNESDIWGEVDSSISDGETD